MWPRITRRRLWKGAHWGVIIVRLNAKMTANTSSFHFMSSKHNPPELRTRCLLASDMGSDVQCAVRGVSQGCEVQCWNSIPGGVSSSPGEWMVRKECLVCWVFQIWRQMPVFLGRAKETRRRYLHHRMWVFQLLWWVVFPKPGNMFRLSVSISSKTARCLDWWTISSTHYQRNLGKAINFSAINFVPQHQDDVQGCNVAIHGLWEKAPEHWPLVILGHAEVQLLT